MFRTGKCSDDNFGIALVAQSKRDMIHVSVKILNSGEGGGGYNIARMPENGCVFFKTGNHRPYSHNIRLRTVNLKVGTVL